MRRGAGGKSRDRGAVIVEFAFVVPVLLALILALADFALAELSDAAGSNAAREGARVGILQYDGAHVPGSANHDLIAAAVNERLAGNVKGTPAVTVRCLNPDGSARPSSGSCSTVSGDSIELGRDFIEVSVTWNRRGGITGFVGSGFRTDKAVMRIVGTPPSGSTTPTTCSFSAASATPASVTHSAGLLPAVAFSVTVSDLASCGTPRLSFPAEAAYSGSQTMALVSGSTFTFTMPAGQGLWTAGAKTVTASANGGATTSPITLTVVEPTVCVISAGTASPSATTHSSGDLPQIVFDVTVSDIGACGVPTLTFPAQAGYAGPQAMSLVSGTSYRFTMPAGQGTWTASTYTVTASATGTTTAITLVVSDPVIPCVLSNLLISPSSAPVRRTGNQDIRRRVRITVTRSSTVLCAVPSITVTPGASGPAGTATDLTTPKAMVCSGVSCEYTIANGTRNWMPAPSTRIVTVTSSGTTVTGTLTLT
ncbi:MAG: TadE/TadG family type IV pilus assembly protein [Actinomycetota bacterium]